MTKKKNQDIVQVNENKLVQYFPENIVYKTLEDSWAVTKTERHYQILVVA